MAAVKVKLVQPHTHAGVRHDKGSVIEVSQADAEFLLRMKVIEKIPGAAVQAEPAAKE